MATMIATSLFQDQDSVTSIVSKLEYVGLSEVDIAHFTPDGTDRTWDQGGLPDRPGDRLDAIEDWLRHEGVPLSDAHAYAEGVRRGGHLVAVRCNTMNVDNIVSILDTGLDIDERQSHWRASGWQPKHAEIGPAAGAASPRDVGHGRVRVYSRPVHK